MSNHNSNERRHGDADQARKSDRFPDLRHWRAEADGDEVWLCIDKADSSTNVLSREVLTEFETLVAALAASPPRSVIIYSGKAAGFISGADINEFPTISSAAEAEVLLKRGHAMLAALEGLPSTTVAMIDGYALGGGLELALACDYRVVADGSERTIGLPEIQLGLHPGFGGTVRTVRLVGVTQAMPLMLTGKSVTPAVAKQLGLVDAVCPPDELRTTAREWARKPTRRRIRRWTAPLLRLPFVRSFIADRIRAGVRSRARPEHYPAPYALVDLWERQAANQKAAFDEEVRSFGRLIETETSRNLVRVYFLQERLKDTAPKGDDSPSVERVHVVGAGVMGGDIAAWCALRGLSVTLQDREMKYIEPAIQRAAKLFDKRLSTAESAAARQRLTADVDGRGVSEADVLIEAIFEDRDAKRSLFADVEPQMRDGAVLASNTSSIPLEELSAGLRDPGRLIGLHFFNPVAKLPLLEVVRSTDSHDDAVEAGLAFGRQIGKLPLPCRSHPGFLVNRILAPYMAEALELVREGVPLPEIDEAAVQFGMPVGPIELIDSVGVDVALHVARILSPVINRPVAPELEALVDDGRLGQKSGHGFYQYHDGKAVKPHAAEASNPDIQERLILSLVNEAAHCLHENVVADRELIDGGVIFGTGFAPFRGGPLHYAAARGIDDVVASLERLTARHGPRFRPSPGWAGLTG